MHSTRLIGAFIAVLTFAGIQETRAQSISADAAALVRQGERLAKAKRYNDALIAFKSADKLFPKAEHDCWVGLAYARLQMATQANFYVARCKQRAGGKRPIPWYPKAKILAENMLKSGRYAAIRFESLHGGASIRPDNFDDDEWLALPTKLWMPVGRYTINAKAPGFGKKQLSLEVTSTRSQTVRVNLKGSKATAGSNTVRFPSLIKSKAKKKVSSPKDTSKKKKETSKKRVSKAKPPPVPKTMPKPKKMKKAKAKAANAKVAKKVSSQPEEEDVENTAASEAPPVDMTPENELSSQQNLSEAESEAVEGSASKTGSSIIPALGWTALGLGLGSLGASFYFYKLGDEAARNAYIAIERDVRSAEIENYQRYSVFTYAAYGVGGGLLATGLALLIYDLVDEEPSNGLSFQITPDLATSGISVSGSF
ncbi:MAG: hypothetical protein VYC39_04200 [Myxococcota bacterium]|nr:hypothetical protein [Myxococcota bacterium]